MIEMLKACLFRLTEAGYREPTFGWLSRQGSINIMPKQCLTIKILNPIKIVSSVIDKVDCWGLLF